MNNLLNHDSPFERFFEEMSRIPHGSGNEKAIADYLVAFAERHGLWHYRDEIHNVVIKKPASPGYESAPAVILQSHTDMVCVQEAGRGHDFTRDPLELVLDGRILRARGTSLGADDIAGVATALALLEQDETPHPPLEAVFTAQEEVGMLGAKALDYSLLTASRMIGMDSGGESESSVCAAGGVNYDIRLAAQQSRVSGHICTLEISGLQGGHSGSCIDLERGNAVRIAARILYALDRVGIEYRISDFTAGQFTNAIPDACKVVFLSHAPAETADLIAQASRWLRSDYAEGDPGLSIKLTQTAGRADVFDPEASRRLTALLSLLPDGRAHKSLTVAGFVTASSNIGVIRCDGESVLVQLSIRGATDSRIGELEDKALLACQRTGAQAELVERYPCWEYMEHSVMRERAARLMREEWGIPLKPSFEHGGLECGYFAKNLPGLDIYIIGPIGRDVHTVNESLDLDSAERVYRFLQKYLTLLKD